MSGSCGARPRVAATGVRGWVWVVAAAVAAAAGLASPATAQRSVPPAEYRPAMAHKAAALPAFALPPGAPVRRIALPPPTAEESVAPRLSRSGSAGSAQPRGKRSRLPIGFARIVPAAERALSLADLPWRATATGTRAAQLALTSPGAAAVRLGVALHDAPPGLAVRFRGSAGDAPVYGPYAGADVEREGVYWTPALDGETGSVELELPAGVAPGAARLELPLLSHLTVAGAGLRSVADSIGQSEACEVDVACLAPALQQQLASATNAVARMMVTIEGATYLCTGTLLNDSLTSFTPYFLTADHCLADPEEATNGGATAAASAGTINTYWFFQADACGSRATPEYALVVGGATLLARSVDYDWALVRLKVAPPSGATFAAWSAEAPLAAGAPADGIHHPHGDLKKLSRGNVRGYRTFDDGSSFIRTGWTSGVTEPGSSGSALFTLNGAASYFEVRGTLSGGESSCALPQGTDYYSRLDAAYPLVAPYLAPTASNPARTTAVVEYYNAAQDGFFITADPFEIAGRDNGVPAGWVRTGYRFLAYTDPAAAPAGVQPVCRLYAPPPWGDTRFYSASPQECAAMLAQPALHFVSESAAAFYLMLPDAFGACPAGTRAVYRFLDDWSPPRRRYTAEAFLRDAINGGGGWTQEGTGTGPDRAAMCAPTEGAATPAPAIANYGGLWWNAPAGSEPGWGINFTHQGGTIFATWFTYDVDGGPLWMVVAAQKTGADTYTGTLYRGTGPAFSATPFDTTKVVGTPVGTATFTFTDSSTATFAYTIGGVAQVKSITREVFSSPVPSCSWDGDTDPALATNYQDLWWNAPAGSESGWGINFTHQGDTIFASWFTYGVDGRPLWLVVSAALAAPRVYAGNLYTGTGPAYSAGRFDPAKVIGTPVGTATFTFADGNNAIFAYTVNGVAQSKALTRQVFVPPGTVCR